MPRSREAIAADRLDFDRLADYITRAIEYTGGAHTLETLWEAIECGDLQLWPYRDSLTITELQRTPSGKKGIHFFLAAGNLEELKALQPIVVAWAITQGATYATMIGRRGWERSFLTRESGWRPTMTMFTRDLQP
jgi:hypothetical protein